jgi:hypothetical protein
MKKLPKVSVKKERISRKALSPGVAKVLKRLHFPVDVILLCVRVVRGLLGSVVVRQDEKAIVIC